MWSSEVEEFSDISSISGGPSNPVLSSTRIGSGAGGAWGSNRSRRRVRVDSSDEDEASNFLLAPFPDSLTGLPNPPQPRYASSQLNSSLHNRRLEASSDEESDDGEESAAPKRSGGGAYADYSASESDNDEVGRSDDDDAVRSDEAEEVAPAGTADADGDVDIEALNRLQRIAKGASKRTVKRPRAKVDNVRVLGENGLPALINRFKKTKFKGRGFEFEDLNKLLFLYEAWANQMLPQFSFSEIMDRLEVIGSNREIHNALQRMRAGTWPISAISNEFVTAQDDASDDDDDEKLGDHLNQITTHNDLLDFPDADFETLMELPGDSQPTQETTPPRPSTSMYVAPPIASPSTNLEETSGENLAERIERNRQLALKRLEARRLASLSTSQITAQARPSVLKNALAATQSEASISVADS